MKNASRNFVKIIKEICGEEGIELRAYSHDWIFRLQKGGAYAYIMGYQFGLNGASVNSICCDKCAASEIMTSLGIPNVEHYFFMSPVNQEYVGRQGNWKEIMGLLDRYGKLVCKANEGTGGNLVFCVSDQYELERAAFDIFTGSRAMAVSPYYEIENEYRLILLNGEVRLAYLKERPYVVGDGVSTVDFLLSAYIVEHGEEVSLSEVSPDVRRMVPEEGEVLYLNWKHNLGQGACARIEDSERLLKETGGIVSTLSEKMGIRFASIDIVSCPDGYRVLEINSGVMMEHFSRQSESAYRIAKDIYRDAILCMLEERQNSELRFTNS